MNWFHCGRSLSAVFKAECDALAWIRTQVARDTRLVADEARHGTNCAPGMRSRGSTTGSCTAARLASTPARQRASSAEWAGPSSVIITTWLAPSRSATRQSRLCGRIAVGSITAGRSWLFGGLRWLRQLRLSDAGFSRGGGGSSDQVGSQKEMRTDYRYHSTLFWAVLPWQISTLLRRMTTLTWKWA